MNDNLIVLTETQFNTICKKYHHKGWIEGRLELKKYLADEMKELQTIKFKYYQQDKDRHVQELSNTK